MDTLFHPGERLVQERTGERATALINSRSITPFIPPAARMFVGQQRWCVLGAADAAGDGVWASLVVGEPGFVQTSEDLKTLRIALDDPHDRLRGTVPLAGLQADQSIAVLLIELQTRRRLRVNGHVASAQDGLLEVAVGGAFPVCPRYIQKRQPELDAPLAVEAPASAAGTDVDATVAAWMAATDTLFIASLGPAGEADVSHRGGRPGFVQVHGNTLRIPDFNGNSMFNTLGNLAVESRCGLMFPDFDGTRQLQLTGRARAFFDVSEDIDSTGGTGRWVEFDVESWRITPLNRPLRWRLVEASPFNP